VGTCLCADARSKGIFQPVRSFVDNPPSIFLLLPVVVSALRVEEFNVPITHQVALIQNLVDLESQSHRRDTIALIDKFSHIALLRRTWPAYAQALVS